MRWEDLGEANCPVARAMSVVGDRWTVLILRDCFRGVSRFDAFHARLGCSRAIVSKRLAHLVSMGVLETHVYLEHPPRHEYRLTEKGQALRNVLMMMAEWGETWLPKAGAPMTRRRHTTCGQPFRPVVACSSCGEALEPGTVEFMDAVEPALEPA